jgi:hypothetical protein
MVLYDENRAGNLRRRLEPHRVWDRGRAESDLWVIGARETRFDLRLTREMAPATCSPVAPPAADAALGFPHRSLRGYALSRGATKRFARNSMRQSRKNILGPRTRYR